MKCHIDLCLFVLTGLLVAGCASGPRFESKKQAGDASFRCEQPGFGDLMSGDSAVAINEIDGVKTAVIKKGAVYYVRPGKHELELAFGRIVTMQVVHQYLEIEALANRQYLLKAYKKDDDFRVDVVDETDPKAPSVVAGVKVKSSPPNIVPIPVPVR